MDQVVVRIYAGSARTMTGRGVRPKMNGISHTGEVLAESALSSSHAERDHGMADLAGPATVLADLEPRPAAKGKTA